MTGIDSPGWRFFTDGGFKRQGGGTDSASWRIAAVSPDNFVRILCEPVMCDPRRPAFLGSTSCSNNTAELTGFAEALRWINFFIHRGERVRILCDSKHAARVAIGVAHARRNISLASNCNDLILRYKGKFHISPHHVYGHAWNKRADIAASFGMNGIISECNVPSFWPTREFLVQRLFNAHHCFARIAEILHNVLARLQLGYFFFVNHIQIFFWCVFLLLVLCALLFFVPHRAQLSSHRGAFTLSLPIPLSISLTMADAYVWISAYFKQAFRSNEVVQMF